MQKPSLEKFKGFEWGSMVFSISQKKTDGAVWVRTTQEPEKAWRFLVRNRGELDALMAVPLKRSGSRTVRKVRVMDKDSQLTKFGRELLWLLLDDGVHTAMYKLGLVGVRVED